jgi:hypothetical protein
MKWKGRPVTKQKGKGVKQKQYHVKGVDGKKGKEKI